MYAHPRGNKRSLYPSWGLPPLLSRHIGGSWPTRIICLDANGFSLYDEACVPA